MIIPQLSKTFTVFGIIPDFSGFFLTNYIFHTYFDFFSILFLPFPFFLLLISHSFCLPILSFIPLFLLLLFSHLFHLFFLLSWFLHYYFHFLPSYLPPVFLFLPFCFPSFLYSRLSLPCFPPIFFLPSHFSFSFVPFFFPALLSFFL